MNRLLQGILVLGLCVGLAGCDEDNWGNKIASFVDDEIHPLTVDAVQRELDVKWFDYFAGITNTSILAVHGVSQLIDTTSIAAAPLETFQNREIVLRMIDAAETNNVFAARMLQSASRELDGADVICDSTNALQRVNIDSLGSKIVSQIVLPKGDWYVEVSCEFTTGGNEQNGTAGGNGAKSGGASGCWKSLVSLVTAVFGADKQRHQKDVAEAAIARIPSKVVGAAEVEDISKKTCKKMAAMAEIRDGMLSGRKALNTAKSNAVEVAKTLVRMRMSLEAHQMPLLLKMVRDASGIERTARDIAAEYELQQVNKSIDDQRKDLESFEKQFKTANICSEAIAASELLERVLAEKRLQLEVARNSDTTYKDNFAPLLNKIMDAQKYYAEQRKLKVSSKCASDAQ